MKKLVFFITFLFCNFIASAQKQMIYNRLYVEDIKNDSSISMYDSVGYVRIDSTIIQIDNSYYWKLKNNFYVNLEECKVIKITIAKQKITNKLSCLTLYAGTKRYYYAAVEKTSEE